MPEVKFAEPVRVEAEHFVTASATHKNHLPASPMRELWFPSLSVRDR